MLVYVFIGGEPEYLCLILLYISYVGLDPILGGGWLPSSLSCTTHSRENSKYACISISDLCCSAVVIGFIVAYIQVTTLYDTGALSWICELPSNNTWNILFPFDALMLIPMGASEIKNKQIKTFLIINLYSSSHKGHDQGWATGWKWGTYNRYLPRCCLLLTSQSHPPALMSLANQERICTCPILQECNHSQILILSEDHKSRLQIMKQWRGCLPFGVTCLTCLSLPRSLNQPLFERLRMTAAGFKS